jgi:hypothetical protein
LLADGTAAATPREKKQDSPGQQTRLITSKC